MRPIETVDKELIIPSFAVDGPRTTIFWTVVYAPADELFLVNKVKIPENLKWTNSVGQKGLEIPTFKIPPKHKMIFHYEIRRNDKSGIGRSGIAVEDGKTMIPQNFVWESMPLIIGDIPEKLGNTAIVITYTRFKD